MKILNYCNQISKLSPEAEEKVSNAFTCEIRSKGDFLFQQNQVCRHIYFLETGFARAYYLAENGREITACFFAENSFITAIDSFFHHVPTRNYCKLVEDSVLYSILDSDLEKLLDQHQEIAKFAFHIMYDIAKQMTEQIANLKFQSAEEKYKALLVEYPHILQRASLGDIASYLGITQETLSRIRAKSLTS